MNKTRTITTWIVAEIKNRISGLWSPYVHKAPVLPARTEDWTLEEVKEAIKSWDPKLEETWRIRRVSTITEKTVLWNSEDDDALTRYRTTAVLDFITLQVCLEADGEIVTYPQVHDPQCRCTFLALLDDVAP